MSKKSSPKPQLTSIKHQPTKPKGEKFGQVPRMKNPPPPPKKD
jgi:hypothetical protein